MSVSILLVGGPADGKEFVIGGDPMNPPPTTELLAPEVLNWREFDAGHIPEIRKLLYRREANRADSGPLWLYRYDEGASAGSVRPDEEPTP